jgi:hypothetical protein
MLLNRLVRSCVLISLLCRLTLFKHDMCRVSSLYDMRGVREKEEYAAPFIVRRMLMLELAFFIT